MQAFADFWSSAVDIAWGLPLVVLLVSSGLYFTISSKFLPFRALRHALDILRGKYDNPDDPGEITHFQALTSALSATIGMGNIAGVALAISVGGPGAIFWMWIAGLIGMATKFFTCTLSCMYRKKDEDGIEQGGPMYFIEVGLGKAFKPLAIVFAVCGMVGCLALYQVNQLAAIVAGDDTSIRIGIGVVSMIIVGIVILGGIVRVGKVTARLVPAMAILYFVAALYIVLLNVSMVPEILLMIVKSAFGQEAVIGGAAGVAFSKVLVTGIKRAAFSNEAGIGTAPMAHGAAKTKEPVREGLVAMMGPFIDTNIVCTLTALVILSTGVGTESDGVVMTANAFATAMPGFGKPILILVVSLFAISTMISYSYYGLKCAKYLFGNKIGQYYIYPYLLTLPIAAYLTENTVINIIDTCFAFMAVPTLISTLLLSRKVIEALRDYFRRMGI